MSERLPHVLFVIGTGCCGSTLVEEVLCRHESVGFVSNFEDRFGMPGRWNGPLYRRLPVGLTRKGRARFAPSEAYNAIAREVSPELVSPRRDLLADDVTPEIRARLRRFVEARASAQRRPYFLHKLTGWPRAGLLGEVFPEARFIHVHRPGADVARSWARHAWFDPGMFGPLRGTIVTETRGSLREAWALLAWRMLMEAYVTASESARPDSWLDVAYADLIADPREAFAEMLDFAGLPWTEEFERGFRRYRFEAGR
ncbi:MAG TPA: sulfotransferase [Thermomicrobiaceae bacterium]|nr:sulfotransferase [Thermomicrobiaceae bacterium]